MSDSKTEGASGSSPSVPRAMTPEEPLEPNFERTHAETFAEAQSEFARHAVRSDALEAAAQVAENPYGDLVEAYGRDEPRAVGTKIAKAIRSLINQEPRRQAPLDALAQARSEGRAAALEEHAKERNDLRSKLEGMARSRDKWREKHQAFTQAAGMKPLRVAFMALLEAVRLSLHTLQDPMRGFAGRCARDLPHDHKDLQTVREVTRLLNKAHDAAVVVIQPLLNQGRDEVAPSPEITSKSPAADPEEK